MECPICMERTGKNVVKLECGHAFCFACASRWVPTHFTCPLCRQESTYFSRATRSKKNADQTLRELTISIEVTSFYAVRFPALEIPLMALIVDKYILQKKHLWYRPGMFTVIKALKANTRELMMETDLYSLDPSIGKIFDTLLQI